MMRFVQVQFRGFAFDWVMPAFEENRIVGASPHSHMSI